MSYLAVSANCWTYRLSIGTYPRVVQELLGHSSYTLTMNTYSYVMPALHRDVAGQMNHLFGRQNDVSQYYSDSLHDEPSGGDPGVAEMMRCQMP